MQLFLFFGHVLYFLCFFLPISSKELEENDLCTEMQKFYHREVSNTTSIAKTVSGRKLHTCPSEYSCCTEEMEEKLQKHGVSDLERTIAEESLALEASFSTKHKRFDDFFKELVENAKSSLDFLFIKTYGRLYSNNSAVFMDLFRDLKAYYGGSTMQLGEVFDNFFTMVMQKVFELINRQQYVLDDEYFQCIADNMNTIQPFSTMPKTMSSQIQRAFMAARTFVQGLAVGRTLASSLAKFHPTHECTRALTKMAYCSKCSGYNQIKPCHKLCMNVLKGCMVDYNRLNTVWNQYIDAMLLLLNRLEGPFNIESVLDPFDVKISEAIMTLQDNSFDITHAVFRICGTPKRNPNATKGEQYGHMDMHEHGDFPGSLETSLMGQFSNLDLSGGPDDDDQMTSKLRTKRSNEDHPRREKNNRKHRRSGGDRHQRRLGRHLEKSGRDKKTKQISIPEERRQFLANVEETRFPYNEKREGDKRHSSVHTAMGTNLAKMVVTIRKMLKGYKDMWNGIPDLLCKTRAQQSDNATCWNGEMPGEYSHPEVGHGPDVLNPEVAVSKQHVPHESISIQLLEMKRITLHLKNAHSGINPQGLDDDDGDLYDYGSGSGEGSGRGGENDTEDLDTKSGDTTTKCPGCGSASFLASNCLSFVLPFFFVLWITV